MGRRSAALAAAVGVGVGVAAALTAAVVHRSARRARPAPIVVAPYRLGPGHPDRLWHLPEPDESVFRALTDPFNDELEDLVDEHEQQARRAGWMD